MSEEMMALLACAQKERDRWKRTSLEQLQKIAQQEKEIQRLNDALMEVPGVAQDAVHHTIYEMSECNRVKAVVLDTVGVWVASKLTNFKEPNNG